MHIEAPIHLAAQQLAQFLYRFLALRNAKRLERFDRLEVRGNRIWAWDRVDQEGI
ncbi:MAG: hypothetical protein ACXU9U_00220 [Parachlamydiaceae bacterium]